jgi:hypothetical protein
VFILNVFLPAKKSSKSPYLFGSQRLAKYTVTPLLNRDQLLKLQSDPECATVFYCENSQGRSSL